MQGSFGRAREHLTTAAAMCREMEEGDPGAVRPA
jgi:hypothetical protein